MPARKDPATKKAILKYQKEKTKNISIRFFPTDMDMYDYLRSKENTTGFIKSLVRREMESENER